MKLRNLISTAVVGLAFAGSSQATVNFVFNYTDASGVGFNASGQTGIDRKAGLERAADIVESLFTNYNADINIDVNGSETDDNTLASAGSNFNFIPTVDGFGGRGDVGIKILGGNGADPNSSLADGTVNWNFEDFQWAPLDVFNPNEQDLISTAAHELLHAVGFLSSVNQDGTDPYGAPAGSPGRFGPFDEFISDSSGAIINSSGVLDGSRWNSASVGGTGSTPAANGLYFSGPNATAANGGNPVPIYSPTTWSDGSSGSHLDTDFFTGANVRMMNHESPVSEGLDIRVVDEVTRNMLKDIGFSNIVIPEPSTGLLVLVGSTLLVFRRRRS